MNGVLSLPDLMTGLLEGKMLSDQFLLHHLSAHCESGESVPESILDEH